MLAPDSGHATVPLAFQFIATMLTTFPASFLMKRIGPEAGLHGRRPHRHRRWPDHGGGDLYRAASGCLPSATRIFGVSAAFTLVLPLRGGRSCRRRLPSQGDLAGDGGRWRCCAPCSGLLASFGQDLFLPHLFAGGFVFIVGLSVLVVPRAAAAASAAIADAQGPAIAARCRRPAARRSCCSRGRSPPSSRRCWATASCPSS